MMDHNPNALGAWIDYITDHYARNRQMIINADKLFNEVVIEVPQENTGGIRGTWRPKRILLVDDETIFNFLHTRILELTRVSQEIRQALNGTEALEFLTDTSSHNTPDIILLDLTMPVMDGFAFLEAFQKLELPNKEKITIIVITSSIDQRDRLRATAMGITHYLVKPVDERELCAAVISA